MAVIGWQVGYGTLGLIREEKVEQIRTTRDQMILQLSIIPHAQKGPRHSEKDPTPSQRGSIRAERGLLPWLQAT